MPTESAAGPPSSHDAFISYSRKNELFADCLEKALENYRKFVELWKNAEPELQPQVKAVREKIVRLSPVEGAKK